MGPKEARFYSQLAPKLALRVPEVHVAAVGDDGMEFVVLLEDLEDTGCRVSDGTWGITRDGAAQALEDLAAMHVRYDEVARREAEAGWVPPYSYGGTYATDRLREGLVDHRDRLAPEFAAVAELYLAEPAAMHELWTGPGATVVHGDTHIGNLFLDGDRVGFFDWGVIHLSPPLRDVSYLLQMAMQPEDRLAHEQELLRHYLDVRRALGGSEIPYDDAWAEHRLRAAYTVVASCQIVTFPADIGPEREVFANAFLARSEAAVRELDALGALRDALGH
jgi:aminoglycoside/choline kinase family phosphotransferase